MSKIKKKPKRKWIWVLVKWLIIFVLLVVGLAYILKTNDQEWGFLSIILAILIIMFGFFKNIFKRLFARKSSSKSQITGNVIAKNMSSQSSDSGFIVIKDTSGNRMNINIASSVFKTVKIGDTVSFIKPKKAKKIIKDLKIVTSAD